MIASWRERLAMEGQAAVMGMLGQAKVPVERIHSSHPDLPHLALLVFEAVLEVVCVSLPGYIVARQGMFTAEMQKFTANLNVTLFTPCLIFTKLASQLNQDKLADLAIIPLIFVVQTSVSYLVSLLVAHVFGFSKRPRNFVIAMSVFGNSNSLPISLVLSLSKTIKGLHWDRIPGDNDGEVAARGILYLLIFQQLGQLLRWTWGYNVLLAPAPVIEPIVGTGAYHDTPESVDSSQPASLDLQRQGSESEMLGGEISAEGSGHRSPGSTLVGQRTPNNPKISDLETGDHEARSTDPPASHIPQFQHKSVIFRLRQNIISSLISTKETMVHASKRHFSKLPDPLRQTLAAVANATCKFLSGLWSFMNPPLWAMLVAIIVASIPPLQTFVFAPGTFFQNSVTSAVRQSGEVAVPLILVVLGGNLARNTLPTTAQSTPSETKEERKLLIASLIGRMLLPIAIMGPILAVTAKFVPVSILDDPIFIIVCFLISGAPSALQLAQICQINNVYMGAMSRLLFQSYVVWILPSTLVLVTCALEVVEWAQQG